jgi:16S rRNA (adenine1518-N6/adenine1519-N6)-dimethyltransferase
VAGAVLMLQREVVARVTARPRTKDYGLLTLRLARSWDRELIRQVPPEVFHPRPRVESAVLRLTPRREPLPVHDADWFDRLLRMGFAQRRKQLHKQLPAHPPWAEVAAAVGLSVTARAEELSLGQWVELARVYDQHPAAKQGQSGEECFDVVDEQDQVTGQATRAEVHRRGLLHRAVHGFVFNRRGEIFLQKRSRLKDSCPGLWDSSAAGHLDAGEDYREAMRREFREELGIEVGEYEEIGRVAAGQETGWEHVRVFRARHDGPLRFPCGEIEDGLWLPVAEVEAWTASCPADFAPGFLTCWKVSRHVLRDPA